MGSLMAPRRLPITRRGRAELAADLASLGSLRREITVEREHSVGLAGSHPAEWARLDRELAAVDEQICRVRCDFATAVLIGDDEPLVAVGSEVTVLDEWGQTTLTIGGVTVANPRLGRLAYDSPLARALLGRTVGDEVEVSEPEGTRRLRVVGVRALPVPRPPAQRGPLTIAVP